MCDKTIEEICEKENWKHDEVQATAVGSGIRITIRQSEGGTETPQMREILEENGFEVLKEIKNEAGSGRDKLDVVKKN